MSNYPASLKITGYYRVADLFRNGWPECSGIGGRNGAEWVAGIKRNIHLSHEYVLYDQPILKIVPNRYQK